jgi:hypothetical protein
MCQINFVLVDTVVLLFLVVLFYYTSGWGPVVHKMMLHCINSRVKQSCAIWNVLLQQGRGATKGQLKSRITVTLSIFKFRT